MRTQPVYLPLMIHSQARQAIARIQGELANCDGFLSPAPGTLGITRARAATCFNPKFRKSGKMNLRKYLSALLLLGAVTTAAAGDEKSIKETLEAKFPRLRINTITKTPYLGLYEVFANEDTIAYTDENAEYLFQGRIVDVKEQRDITAARRSDLNRINFNELPLELALKMVKGNGSRKMAVFADPDCPFCKQLEQSIAQLDNVTVYTFLFPLETLHPGAREHAKMVWCAADRNKVWNDAMRNGVIPKGRSDCATPLEKIADLGSKYRVNATPTIFFANGRKVEGAMPVEQLDQALTSSNVK